MSTVGLCLELRNAEVTKSPAPKDEAYVSADLSTDAEGTPVALVVKICPEKDVVFGNSKPLVPIPDALNFLAHGDDIAGKLGCILRISPQVANYFGLGDMEEVEPPRIIEIKPDFDLEDRD
jgi:hypothetical protein